MSDANAMCVSFDRSRFIGTAFFAGLFVIVKHIKLDIL